MIIHNADRIADIPSWDVILNYKGFPLYTEGLSRGLAIIAKMQNEDDLSSINWEKYKNGELIVDIWLVMDEEYKSTHTREIMDAVSIIQNYKGFHIVGQVYTKKEIVEALYDLFSQRLLETDTTAGSDEHSFFDKIGLDALTKGASDIHITIFPETTEIKFRVKGELKHYKELSRERGLSLVTSIYNTLVERGSTKEGFNERAYQDGVIERVYPQGLVRFRYSGMPIAPSGADITLRLIPIGVNTKKRSLIELGYSKDQVDQLDRIFSRSSGMALIAGTTGSGKSTTIATILEDLAERFPGKKIRTVEQPVEYRIRGAYQTPVLDVQSKDEVKKNPFLIALRQIMRADPDIISIGEIRDIDTANVAIQGVRSGHFLVSTIHADGAPVCYDRLVGMGVSRQDLATVGIVAGFIYQKLVPILCDHCKISYKDYISSPNCDHRLVKRLKNILGDDVDNIYFRNPDGCEHCHYDGIIRREVVAEILRPTPSMSKAIMQGDSVSIWRAWRSTINHDDPSDMTGRTAFEHALYKMRLGLVDPRDVEAAFKYIDEPVFDDTWSITNE